MSRPARAASSCTPTQLSAAPAPSAARSRSAPGPRSHRAPASALGTGSVSFNPTITQADASTFSVELDLAAVGAADLLNVTGTVALNNAILQLSFANAASLSTPQTFLIVNNDGDGLTGDSVDGQFGFITNPAGYAVIVNYAFLGPDSLGRIGKGNDIAVTVSLVPEPTGHALLAAGTGMMVRRRRRRHLRSIAVS